MVFQYNRENETNTENEVVDVESRRGEAWLTVVLVVPNANPWFVLNYTHVLISSIHHWLPFYNYLHAFLPGKKNNNNRINVQCT